MENAELVKADFFDDALLLQVARQSPLFPDLGVTPPAEMYRLTSPGAPRLYFTKRPVRTYASVTSILHATCPTSPHLIKWIAQHGLRQAEYLRDSRAAYGTCMHKLFSDFLVARTFDLAGMPAWLAAYLEESPTAFDTGGWAADLAQDLVGFGIFCREYNVRPVGIEVPLSSEELGYAGTLDLVALLDYPDSPKGKKPGAKNVLQYVDWKSNRESFHDDQYVQVNAYRDLWNVNFPYAPMSRTSLYAPNAWDETSRVRYRFADATHHRLAKLFPNLVENFAIRNPSRGSILELAGVVTLGGDAELASFTTVEGIIERLTQQEAA